MRAWEWAFVAASGVLVVLGFASERMGLAVSAMVFCLIGALGRWLSRRGDFDNPRLVVGLGTIAMAVVILAFVALAIDEQNTKYLGVPIVMFPLFVFGAWAWTSSGKRQRTDADHNALPTT